MVSDRRYSIKKNRLINAAYGNMEYLADASDSVSRKDVQKNAFFLLPALDGAENNSVWGRLSMDVEAEPSVVYIVHIIALNEQIVAGNDGDISVDKYLSDFDVEQEKKNLFFKNTGEVRAVNLEDVLLYSLKGRYLWIYIEIQGEGSFAFSNMKVDMVGDNFMMTFPQVYRERNSFFHRYMSIFSSIYNDFQSQIDKLPGRFDIENTSCEFLIEYLGWLGIDILREYVDDGMIRKLAAEAFELKRYRGTRYVLERIGEIMLGEKPVIIERRQIIDNMNKTDKQVSDALYGENPYDVSVLTTVECNDSRRRWLSGFLEQFIPVRCKLKLIFLCGHNKMDTYTYMGVNARLWDAAKVRLDEGTVPLDEMGIMK